jgi:hypothetical protein
MAQEYASQIFSSSRREKGESGAIQVQALRVYFCQQLEIIIEPTFLGEDPEYG